MKYTITPLSDESIVIELGEKIDVNIQKSIQVLTSYLKKRPFPGMKEYIPAYTTLTIYYDLMEIQAYTEKHKLFDKTPYQLVQNWVNQLIEKLPEKGEASSRVIQVPVCYGGDHGPDLGVVAKHNGLTDEDVIGIHSGKDYLVYMIGFAPGFPYIGGMSEEIATPRKGSPRLEIPARTVGIAGKQTGVYPIETPGGWQLIGRTPIELFRQDKEKPSLLQPGDTIRFYSISEDEYENWQEDRHVYQHY